MNHRDKELAMNFEVLVTLVRKILAENPETSAFDIESLTGADYEDVLWALKRANSGKVK
jgi:hypothetical protein